MNIETRLAACQLAVASVERRLPILERMQEIADMTAFFETMLMDETITNQSEDQPSYPTISGPR